MENFTKRLSLEAVMEMTEYLELFSGEGTMDVEVMFRKSTAFISRRKMQATEIYALIDHQTGRFKTEMCFDEHPHKILKYEINPAKNKLTIHAEAILV